MSRYQTSTMGQYCRMLAEDAVHAINHEVRVYDDDGIWLWEEDDYIDPEEEVMDVIREICLQLQMSMASANAHEALVDKSNYTNYFNSYMDEVMKYDQIFRASWAWLGGGNHE